MRIEAVRLRPILGNVQKISKKLVVIFSDSRSMDSLKDLKHSQDVYLEMSDDLALNQKIALKQGVEEALRLSKQSDRFLIVTCKSSKPPLVAKILRMAAAGS